MSSRATLDDGRLQQMIAPMFERFLGIQRLILFGSRARGDYEERSDIDLAIDAESITDEVWDAIYFYKEENLDTLLSIDLVWIQRSSERLQQKIKEEGVILFERETKPKFD